MLAEQTAAPSYEYVAAGLFFGFAALTCLSAWAIVLSQNVVRMSVYLLLTLGGVAGLYFMLNAELLAAVQLIVYAGGTLILIVFGIMLTSRNPFMQLRAKPWEMAVGMGIGLSIAGLMLLALVNSFPDPKKHTAAYLVWTGASVPVEGHWKVEEIGGYLLTTFLVPFEVAGVLLLVVMIGAAYMARRRAKE